MNTTDYQNASRLYAKDLAFRRDVESIRSGGFSYPVSLQVAYSRRQLNMCVTTPLTRVEWEKFDER